MRKVIYIFIVLLIPIGMVAKTSAIDAKYIPVGVMSNDWDNQLGQDPNIRKLEGMPGKYDASMGKKVLDILLCRDAYGLHMDRLYSEALHNTILEEEEVAELDMSAEKKDVLKKDIADQLLKANYIVFIRHIYKKHLLLNDDVFGEREFIEWEVYHVDIDDNIINQAYLNWQSPRLYDMIKVPVTRIAGHTCKPQRLRFDIYKRVPEFAIRSSIIKNKPITTRLSQEQGVKKCDKIYIYENRENSKQEIHAKRVGVARVVNFENSQAQLYPIGGQKISARNGQVALLRNRNRSSLALVGEASFGTDPRYGGRLQYDYLIGMSKHGIAQYALLGCTFNTYQNKEPYGYWWQEMGPHKQGNNEFRIITPRLSNFDLSVGYGVGFNFLQCIELMPYITLGWGSVYLSPEVRDGYIFYWDAELNEGTGDWKSESWNSNYLNNFAFHTGGLLRVNIYYPLQFELGVDYNIQKFVGIEPKILDCHQQNRLNLFAGFRVCF